jgi:2-dehydropantoate 2-reductase
MKIMIVGAGAVGCWIGANLIRAGHDVTFIGRPRFLQDIKTDGLRVTLPRRFDWRFDPRQVFENPAAACGLAPFDVALLCMKAHAVADALPGIAPLVPHYIQTLGSAQNGMGSEACLAEAIGADRVLSVTLTSPVSAPAPNVISLDREGGGLGVAAVGAAPVIGAKRLRAWATEYMPVHDYADYRAMKWSKLLLNIVANANCAIFDKDARTLYADPSHVRLELAMIRECLAVMRAAGIAVTGLPGFNARTLATAAGLLPDTLLGPLLSGKVSGARGAKRASMHMDMTNGAPRSEVRFLNGAVVALGEQHGVPTPVNRWITETLEAMVGGEPRDMTRLQTEVRLLFSLASARGDTQPAG